MKRIEWIKKNRLGFLGDQVFLSKSTHSSYEAWERLNQYLLEEVDEFGVSTKPQ